MIKKKSVTHCVCVVLPMDLVPFEKRYMMRVRHFFSPNIFQIFNNARGTSSLFIIKSCICGKSFYAINLFIPVGTSQLKRFEKKMSFSFIKCQQIMSLLAIFFSPPFIVMKMDLNLSTRAHGTFVT